MAYENLSEHKRWLQEKQAQQAVEALKKNGFQAEYIENAAEAFNQVMAMIPAGAKVGVGGSVTIRQMGFIEALKARGHIVYDHWQEGLSREEVVEARRGHLNCDVFLTSTNALTLDGKLVNIDGGGNRVAAMIFGPRKTIIIAGINKLVRDLETALIRVKNRAAIPTHRRRGDQAVCLNTGYCVNCHAPDRLCRVTTIIEAVPMASPDYHIIIVGEELGY